MAQISKVEAQIELKCPAEKFYELFTNKAFLLPKICPDKMQNIQVLQGDWASVGSVKLWSFASVLVGGSETLTERIEAVDEQNKSITFEIFGGEIVKNNKSFKSTLQVSPKGEGCMVKWTFLHENQNDASPAPNKYLDFLESVAKDIEAYFLKP